MNVHPPTEPKSGLTAAIIYSETKTFFGSPIFFIALGCLFLLAAYYLLDRTHPSFVFLLAILGVSIVLYGTGSQGVGSADFKDIPIRVAVAGGAGVLAAVFGFGIIWQSDKIPEIFKTQRKYALVRLAKANPNFDFTKYFISARSYDGAPLHVLARSNMLQIVIPLSVLEDDVSVCITAFDPTGKQLSRREPDNCVSAKLKPRETADGNAQKQDKSDEGSKRRDFERIYEGELKIDPTTNPDDRGDVFRAQ
jgi:multisubunit Na+/H+ antiporter MnhC subunit